MFTYILRKLMYMPFILLGVVALTFMLFTVSTKPEALATIQLGEKASARSKYEWLATKGYVEFTERGREKLSKMEKQQIPARGTMLFNASILADLASERDYLKSEIDALAGEDPEDKDVKARLARLDLRRHKNEVESKAAIANARQTCLLEKAGQANLDAVAKVDDFGARKAAAQEALDKAKAAGGDTADLEKAARDAAADHEAALKEHEAALALVSRVKSESEKITKVEDIEPDLDYTNIFRQFVNYTADLLRLDFGDTRQGRAVTEVLWSGAGPSLALLLPAFLLSELIALFFGLLAAMYRKSSMDHTIVISSIVLMSLNGIAIIIAGQKFLASDWNYFPISGYSTGFGATRYLILPALLYVLLSFGEHVRFNRIIMLDEVGQDYVRTARSKGLNENQVLFKHVLRNSLIPLITRWAVAIPTLYTGSLILESFFGIPGLGYLTVDAIANSDGNVIRAIVVIGAVSFMLANLLSDVLYAVVDPRVRLS